MIAVAPPNELLRSSSRYAPQLSLPISSLPSLRLRAEPLASLFKQAFSFSQIPYLSEQMDLTPYYFR